MKRRNLVGLSMFLPLILLVLLCSNCRGHPNPSSEAIRMVMRIAKAEQRFHEVHGRYAYIDELRTFDRDIRMSLQPDNRRLGYRFDVTLTVEGFQILAHPYNPRLGTDSLFVDQTLTLRRAYDLQRAGPDSEIVK